MTATLLESMSRAAIDLAAIAEPLLIGELDGKRLLCSRRSAHARRRGDLLRNAARRLPRPARHDRRHDRRG